MLNGKNGSLFTMKQYEFLYHPVKDLTNAYSANSKPIDHKETTFPIFHT